MMNIEINRYGFGVTSTLGRLSISEDDHTFSCFTLEDERRKYKVAKETCIPPGTYEIKLRPEGGMHKDYMKKFPKEHVGMLWLQDVPGFTWVYIHIGNKENQTDGCVLVGFRPIVLESGEFEVGSSTDAYLALYRRVSAAILSGERVFVHIRENKREE